ncbi:hypothetical protein VP01_3169g2 [Puccinia sorghi]|uniref:U3 small nucleolar RNA-associated protein 25 n=1 Tax=Puccinia sorghi TaxID=27349 RepID=A0A0L6V0L6_9BASI|nr:hypothetical protein VP01_3169g2 [Puccinia sorghi]
MNNDELRIKLLTLLNVVAAKPPSTTEIQGRDWIQIAKLAANPPKKLHQEQPQETHLSQHHQAVDLYHRQFAPNTPILNPKALAQKEDRWKLSSNSKSNDHRRIVCFAQDHQQNIPTNTIPLIPTALQPALEKLTHHETLFWDSIKLYQDVLHTGIPYDHNRPHLQKATSLWLLQHILKLPNCRTRAEIIKNNEHLAQSSSPKKKFKIEPEPQVETPSGAEGSKVDRDIRDQGFTRPKVLILLPFRSSARDWVHSITSLSSSHTTKGVERFEKEYGLPPGTIDKLDADDAPLKYPLDHRIIFRGNIDDDFFLPIKFNRKEIRLYSDFYQSDLIIGSPVGLRKFIEKEGILNVQPQGCGFLVFNRNFYRRSDGCNPDAKLGSLGSKLSILHMMKQHWKTDEKKSKFVFERLNQIPKKPRDTDFSRVKPWYLDSHARHLRQSILFSAHISPEQNSLFRTLDNLSGKSIQFHHTQAYSSGLLWKVRRGLQQTWLTFDAGSDSVMEDELRFEFFRNQILAPLQLSALVKEGLGGVLIFIPSYFDFVRLESLLRSMEDVKFATISEYSTPSEISAARSSFFNRHVSYLLVTERFHFYHRYKIRGAQRIIFYSPPFHPEYYLEFVNEFPFLMQNPNSQAARVSDTNKPFRSQHVLPALQVKDVQAQLIFSPRDKSKIEPIVGLQDCQKMLNNLAVARSFTFV